MVYTKFESELAVRPDDIDMYQHVHSSRYMDYVLAARFDQMERCYGMPMAEFQKLGYGWVVASTQMHFRRPLVLGDRMTVRWKVEAMRNKDHRIPSQKEHASNRKPFGCAKARWQSIAVASRRSGDIKRRPSVIEGSGHNALRTRHPP